MSLAQPQAPVLRVFLNEQGKLYAAEKAKSLADCEKVFPTGDMLEVLDETPITQEEMIQRIINLGVKRTAAVLAPAPTVETVEEKDPSPAVEPPTVESATLTSEVAQPVEAAPNA